MDGSPASPRRQAFPWLVLGALGALVLLTLRLALGGGVLAQDLGWPTPPPGPGFPVPSAAQIGEVVTTSVDRPGSEVAVVEPGWPGPVPLIPPIPFTALTFDEGAGDGPPVHLEVDAGTFSQTVQLRITPAERDSLPSAAGRILWAFDIEAFDAAGRAISAALQRPIKLSISAAGFTAAGIDGSRLLFGLAVGGQLTPIATSLTLVDQQLIVRLVSLGTVVLIEDPD